jgi:pyridoxine kinase
MRILAVSSQVVWGPVGNSAAVPALQARGHEVLALPTITLSNHPGHGQPAGFRTDAADMARMIAALEALGALDGLDAVLTGYFASAGQVEEVARLLDRIKVPFVLVDPVMGDHGRLYVAEDVASAIADLLVPRATCLTPNSFELSRLSGKDVTDESSAVAAARELALPEVLATSIPGHDGKLTTLLVTRDEVCRFTTDRLEKVPNGTGDFLSGLYLAGRLIMPHDKAFAEAVKTLSRAILQDAGKRVLDVAGALHPGDDHLFVGIDGCRGGWVVVRWDGSARSSPDVQFIERIDQLNLSGVRACAVDMPIGFMDVTMPGGRRAEMEARSFLTGKTSSVFSAPCRLALSAKSYEEAVAINVRNSRPPGKGLSLQSFGLIPKLKEVDDFMTVERQKIIHESHPEVSFAIMNGNVPVLSKKRTEQGREERRRLLVANGFPFDRLSIARQSHVKWSPDDLLDACACAWSARRIAEGSALRFPADPPRDAKGLRMEINA